MKEFFQSDSNTEVEYNLKEFTFEVMRDVEISSFQNTFHKLQPPEARVLKTTKSSKYLSIPFFEEEILWVKFETLFFHKVMKEIEGDPVGVKVGRTEILGESVGLWVEVGIGSNVGEDEGSREGSLEGNRVGGGDGREEGRRVGNLVGKQVGEEEGKEEGRFEGENEGFDDGVKVGDKVGSFVG